MKCLKCSEWVLTVSMGHVTVRIHGKARNFLYCRPAVWNTQIQFLFHNIQNMLHIITRKSAKLKSSYLIQLLDHLAHDFAVLFALTHLCCDDTLKKNRKHAKDKALCWYAARMCALAGLLAFAPRALDEEADEVEERGVSVWPIRLNPVIYHRLLRQQRRPGES